MYKIHSIHLKEQLKYPILLKQIPEKIDFFNSETMEQITNLFLSKIRLSRECKNINDVFAKIPDNVLNFVKINSTATIIDESYIAVIKLNGLRYKTSSFKYIFTVISESCAIEEALVETEEFNVDKLTDDQKKSISLQLCFAIQFASEIGVKNLPSKIMLRKINNDTLIPFYNGSKVFYVKSFGYIPVFVNLTGEIAKKIDLYAEQTRILSELKLNMYMEEEYNNIITTETGKILGMICQKRNINYYYLMVRSFIERMDYLRFFLDETNDVMQQYLAVRLLRFYSSAINILLSDFEKKSDFFLPERESVYYKYSQERYITDDIIKSDKEYIEELKEIELTTNDFDHQELVDILSHVITVAFSINSKIMQHKIKQINNKRELLEALLVLRTIIANTVLIESIKGIVENYKISLHIEDLVKIKQTIGNALYDVKERGLTKIIHKIEDLDDVIILFLYDTFVDTLPDILKNNLNTYLVQNVEDVEAIYQKIYELKIVASDVIAVIYSDYEI